MSIKSELLKTKYILETWTSWDASDEYFNYLGMTFDIGAASRIAETKPYLSVKVSPRWSNEIPVDHDYMEKADLTIPVILATILKNNKPVTILIDGHHRMAKAASLGIERLPAKKLSYDETMSILI